ncbi:MAG: hypothetical protein PVI57_19780 [Gemmatimonadota bacterium]
MDTRGTVWKWRSSTVLLLASLTACGGGDGSTDVEDGSGATLRGTVVLFQPLAVSPAGGGAAGASFVPTPPLATAAEGVEVRIGGGATTTDASGGFTLQDLPLGDQAVRFTKDGSTGTYSLDGIEANESFVLNGIVVSGTEVATEHTGTWVGTGGSTDPGSQGQMALTMVIEASGNAISGTAFIPPPDSTTWSFTGTEDGSGVEVTFSVLDTKSECAAGGELLGTFSADTLSGTFVEVNPPAGCGPPENGIFRVVKQ